MKRTTALVSAALLGASALLAPAAALADGLAPAPTVTAVQAKDSQEVTFTVTGCPAGTDSVQLDVHRANSDEKLADIQFLYTTTSVTSEMMVGQQQVFATCLKGDKAVSATSEARFTVTEVKEFTGTVTTKTRWQAGKTYHLNLTGFEGNTEVKVTLLFPNGKIHSETLIPHKGATTPYEVDWSMASGTYTVVVEGVTTKTRAVTTVKVIADKNASSDETETSQRNQLPKTGV